jgi:hypothetical protein
MPLDITLISIVLKVLNNAADRPDYTEELVGLDVEMIARRTIPSHQIRDALRFAQQKGWAKEGTDDFGQPTWSLTDAGKLKLNHP